MIGEWKGFYKYDNANDQKLIGFDQTHFTIVIDSFDGRHFQGIVFDDVETGGMEGQGKVSGEIVDSKIHFKKLMPKRTSILKDGKRQSSNIKHPTIYYSGTLSLDKQHATGVWKFGWQTLFLFGLIPFPYKSAPGTWSMSLK